MWQNMKRVIVIGSPGVSDRIGKKRDDIPWTEHEFDEEFRQFIVEFPGKRDSHFPVKRRG